jgi:DNA-binding MarR family transcriptional regulator
MHSVNRRLSVSISNIIFSNIEITKQMNEIAFVELLWNVHRRILKRLNPLARRQGMSILEVVVLWKTQQSGGRRVTELADDLGVSPSTATGVLGRLVKAGWLVREPDAQDRRAVIMRGTGKLARLMRSVKQTGSRILEDAFRKLPAQTRERLATDLASLLDCLDQEEGGS